MSSEFTELIARLRAGDARAAEELLRQYERVVRLEVRHRLRDSRLRRVFDSVDICQSVLGSFFVRASLGEYDLDDPADLVKLLVGITQNKVAEQVRKERRQCRDYRRAETLDEGTQGLAASDPSPSDIVGGEELRQAALRELSEEERLVAERRSLGRTWDEIAAELGGTAQARRQQQHRAIARVVTRLGLDEEGA
jgi:RNA polymerase sigma-70 factor (ECF subfamily)